MKNSFLINEIYPCLQGEGINLGKPSLLIRFQICNLRCTWCDTPFTHTLKSDPIDKNDVNSNQKFLRYSLDSLIKNIESFNLKHLIFSGGEPTLQNLAIIMKSLGKNFTAEVETNGTRIPHLQLKNFFEDDYYLMQWNVSPKFSNAKQDLEPDALKHWASLAEKHELIFFKFVVRKQFASEDICEILKIINTYKISKDRVFLMPEGNHLSSQILNKWLHDECLKLGFRYTPRLHVLIFEDLRGV